MNYRRLRVFFVLSFCLIALTGCGGPYKRSDVIDYVKAVWGFTAFKVCMQPKETKGEDGYTDYEWAVTEEDGSQFLVVDDYRYGMEWVTHSLRDNRNYLRAKQYLQEADCSDFTVKDEANGWQSCVKLQFSYADRGELRRGIKRLNELAAGCPPGIALSYELQFRHPFRGVQNHSSRTGDTSGLIKGGETLSAAESEANMLSYIIDMRCDRLMREFTEAEIRALLKDNSSRFGVRLFDGSCKVYDDLLMNRLGYGISFPTLYEVLKRSGYAVSGTKERYSFKGIDGHTYEFSNDFAENQSYYYIMDGKRVPMEHNYNHWGFHNIKQMTGIQCVYFKDAISAKSAENTGNRAAAE